MSSMDLKILRSRVESVSALPTIPSAIKRLFALIEKPRVTLDEVSLFVGNDPALTMKVLKMVNSAMYGFPGRISSVSHAIMLLGLNVVKGLLLGVSMCEMMQTSMLGLWEHSTSCAVVARAIAKKKGCKEPDEISVAALLHDVGKVILLLQFPQEYGEALKDAKEKGISITAAEKLHFAESHAMVGEFLFEKWHFPSNLVESVACHHHPQLATLAPLETNIVHFADVIVRARGVGFAGDDLVPPLHPAAFEMMQLSETDLHEIMNDLEASTNVEEGMNH